MVNHNTIKKVNAVVVYVEKMKTRNALKKNYFELDRLLPLSISTIPLEPETIQKKNERKFSRWKDNIEHKRNKNRVVKFFPNEKKIVLKV